MYKSFGLYSRIKSLWIISDVSMIHSAGSNSSDFAVLAHGPPPIMPLVGWVECSPRVLFDGIHYHLSIYRLLGRSYIRGDNGVVYIITSSGVTAV